MNYIISTYITYLVVSVLLTIYVAKTLYKNGRVFLVDIFHGNNELADSVNKLLLVGFYLINIGYAVMVLKIWGDVETPRMMIEILSTKIGTIILILGAMHFFNLYIFYTLRKRAKHQNQPGHFVKIDEKS